MSVNGTAILLRLIPGPQGFHDGIIHIYTGVQCEIIKVLISTESINYFRILY